MAKKELKTGDRAPDFSLKDPAGSTAQLGDFKGQWTVLYFYPKDNTPGCTIEALDFTRLEQAFAKLNAVVLGVSPDSCESHAKFVKGKKLRVTLLSDPEHKALGAYDVWQQKEFMGNKFMGVVRSTFVIDPEGKIAHCWRAVKADGHAAAVREKLGELQRGSTIAR